MINITNQRAKEKFVAEMIRLQVRQERVAAIYIKKILNQQFKGAAKLVSEFRQKEFDTVLTIKPLREVLIKIYRTAATVFSDRFFQAMKKSSRAPELKGVQDEFWRYADNFISTESLIKVQAINETTREVFRVILKSGMDEGLSNGEIAKQFQTVAAARNPYRANLIAQTEVHEAAMYATQEAAKTTRIMKQKEWVSALDSRTRPEHAAANGQIVGVDESYNVGGEMLQYPGDSGNGSPWNTINCRCVEIYLTQEDF